MFRIKSAKILALVLAIVTVFSATLPAFAAEHSFLPLYIQDAAFPDELYYREAFEISGIVQSATALSRVSACIYDEAGRCVQSKTFKTRATSFDLSKFNPYLDFTKLSCSATYLLSVQIKDVVYGWVDIVDKEIVVNDPYVSTDYGDTESTVLTFSLKEDGNRYISKNFRVKEFASKDGSDTILIDRKLVALLQQVRTHFGSPVVINSGYRSPAHNANTPNAKSGSYHTRGMAADIRVSGVSSLEVCRYAEELGVNGIGWYASDKDGYFSHLDTRPRSKRFYWQTQKTIGVSTFM